MRTELKYKKPVLYNLMSKMGMGEAFAQCQPGSGPGAGERCLNGDFADDRCDTGNSDNTDCRTGNSASGDCGTGNSF